MILDLRPAVPADAGAIRDLVRAVYGKWVPLIGREPKPMRADYAAAIAAHRFALLEEGGALMALIEMAVEPEYLLIENIAVAEAAQGKGIGSALLHHAESVAGQLGLLELQLYTNARMESNLALYARRGYAEYRRDPYANGADVVHMRKRMVSE